MAGGEDALRERIGAWLRALEAEDTPALLGLMAPDAVFLAPGRAPVEGREAWLRARDPRPHGVEFRCELQGLAVYGEAAHAWFELELVVPAEEGVAEARVEGHLMALYRRDGAGEWWLAREARMLAPARG